MILPMKKRLDHPEDDSGLLAGLITLAGGVASGGGASDAGRASSGNAPGNTGWTAADLASIWRHQLGAPLALDLSIIAPDAQATVTSLCAPLSIKSTADLLAHPSPPLEVLRMAKDLSRAQSSQSETAYPDQVAVALYYLAIALGLGRLGRRLSAMDDARLCGGMEWVKQQRWLDQATRDIANEALHYLERRSPGDGTGSG
jgi:hypothetical protein